MSKCPALLLAGFLLALAPGVNAASVAAEFRGYKAIEQRLNDRLFVERFSFEPYFDGLYGSELVSILNLLGSYSFDVGTVSEFRNGQPNAVNMLFWYFLGNALGREVGQGCLQSRDDFWRTEFRESLEAICQWPQAAAKDPRVMERFWIAMMSYDAPREEFEAWRDFFVNGPHRDQPAHEAVRAMVMAAFLNPYFLLKH